LAGLRIRGVDWPALARPQLELRRDDDRLAFLHRRRQVGNPTASGVDVIGMRLKVWRPVGAFEQDNRVLAEAQWPAQLEVRLERGEASHSTAAGAAQPGEPLVELCLDCAPWAIHLAPELMGRAAARADRNR